LDTARILASSPPRETTSEKRGKPVKIKASPRKINAKTALAHFKAIKRRDSFQLNGAIIFLKKKDMKVSAGWYCIGGF
jgi:hypothetical protein